MRKLISSLIALSLINSAYAYYASPGTTVSEAKVTGITKKGNMELSDLKVTEKKTSLKKTMSVNVMALTSDAMGPEYSAIKVWSGHNIALYNSTKEYRYYTYHIQLSAGPLYQDRSYDIALPPNGGSFSTTANLEGYVKGASKGTYRIRAITYVTGPEALTHEANATLTVTR